MGAIRVKFVARMAVLDAFIVASMKAGFRTM